MRFASIEIERSFKNAINSIKTLLETVDKYHYAQGAFNVNAVAQAKAAIEVHEMFRSAAILQGADLPTDLWAAVQISRMQLWKTRRSS